MSDLGVADPIHVPRAVAQNLGSVRPAAWAFVALFAVAAVLRFIVSSGGASFPADLGPWALSVLSIDLVILLPAVALIGSPDVGRAVPLVFRGLVLVALATFLRPVATAVDRFLPGIVGTDPLTGAPGVGSFLLSAAISAIGALGIVVVAIGLWPASRRPTTTGRVALGVIVAAVVVVAVVGQAIVVLVGSPPWESVAAGDVGSAVALTIAYLAGYIQALAWAGLVWVLIRIAVAGPRPSTLAGAGAAVVTAAFFSLTFVSVALGERVSGVAGAFGVASTVLALGSSLLLVSAFSLRLADAARAARLVAAPRGRDRQMPKYRRTRR